MNREKMIEIADRNLNKAKRALSKNLNRKGITDVELKNLTDNAEYAQVVYNLIEKCI